MRLKEGDIVLERYKVEKFLGAGAMGEVYLGRHSRIGNLVAMKVLLIDSNEQVLARFKREARLMAKVRHPNVVSIHDYGELDSGLPCIVMEYLEGEDLESMIFDGGVMAWRDAVELLLQMLDGLRVLHENGIIHRDLKPSNMILTNSEPRTLKLVDFGTARSMDVNATKLTAAGMMVGTPAYMAPEVLMGEPATSNSDLYAIGLILYELISGTLPFESNNMSQVLKRIRKPLPEPVIPDDKPPLPRNLLKYLMQHFLATEPEDRVSSSLGCKRQLERFLISTTANRERPKLSPGKAMILKPRRRKRAPKPTESSEPSTSRTPLPECPTMDTPPEQKPRWFREHSDAEKRMMTARTVDSQPFVPQSAKPSRKLPVEPSNEISGETLVDVVEAPPVAPSSTPVVSEPNVDSDAFSSPEEVRARVVLMAKLPPSLVASRTERSWLNELMSQRGRAFVFGGQFWIAIFVGANDRALLRDVHAVETQINEKYGSMVRVGHNVLDESFKLSAAALSGTAALPEAMQSLIKELS